MTNVIPFKVKEQPGCDISLMRTLADLRVTDASSDLILISGQLKVSLAQLKAFIEALPDTEGRDILFCECSHLVSALEQAQGRLRLISSLHASLSRTEKIFFL